MMSEKKQKILIVIHSFQRGGTELFVLNLIQHMNKEKFDISIFALSQEGGLMEAFEGSASCVFYPEKNKKNNKIKTFIESVSRLKSVIRNHRPDLIHCFLTGPYLVTHAATSTITSPPPIVMSRRSRNHYQKKYPALRWIEKWCHNRTHKLIANSKKVEADLVAETKSPTKVARIYNGIPMEEIVWPTRADAREILGLSETQNVILCVANLIPYKGHVDLLHALSKLPPQLQVICLCVGGGVKEYDKDLHALRDQLKLNTKVRFEGAKDDVRLYEAASDIAVLPSHEEGFSNAILEAMRASLPVVATNVGGNAEAIQHERCGLIVPPHNPDDLAAALATMLENPTLRQTYGTAAQARCKKLFSLNHCALAHELLWQDVLNSKNSI